MSAQRTMVLVFVFFMVQFSLAAVFYPTGAAGPEGWSTQKRGGHKIPRKAQPSKLPVRLFRACKSAAQNGLLCGAGPQRIV